jgi:hypothetical protein
VVKPSKVHVVPFAVKQGVRRSIAERPFAERRGIAFIGLFHHAPNPDAVHHLINDILPLVWRRDPTITCRIVGHGWSPKRLPRLDPRVEVIDPVADLDTVFDQVRLTVAPMRFGAGIKGKVLDSFAAGRPSVMTPIAAEGLALPVRLQALVAEAPQALADLIVRYQTDAAANAAASASATQFIANEFTPASVTRSLGAALGSASSEIDVLNGESAV